MNITLAAPPNVIQNVRCWAEEQGTSLNQYIRDLLIAKDREIRRTLSRWNLDTSIAAPTPPNGRWSVTNEVL